VEAIALQSLKLPNPIHATATDGSPIVFMVRFAHHILAVTVSDTFFGQQMITGWIRHASYGRGVSGIPIQHEVLTWNRLQHGSRLIAGCRVAGHLILEQQHDVVLRAASGSLLQLSIDDRPIRLLIIQPPIVETANSVRIERFAKRDTTFQQLILSGGIEVRAELVARFALR
jgi:hypothetical protein